MSDEQERPENTPKRKRGRPKSLDNIVNEAVEDLLLSAKEGRRTVLDYDSETGESKPIEIGADIKDKAAAVNAAIKWVAIKHKLDDSGREGSAFGEDPEE